MPNYQPLQTFTVGKFTLDVHPYVAPPDNRFEQGAALQYGADFKTTFTRGGRQTDTIGLIQLIFPQTTVFPHTRPGAWNVDKRAPDDVPMLMQRCLYGSDGARIGIHSEFYAGQPQRHRSETECWLIDTPREFNAGFDGQGRFTGVTTTKFANYVVELSGPDGIIFDSGITWGYSVVQDADPAGFTMDVTAPRAVLLSKTSEHRQAIASFLGGDVTAEQIKALIS